MSALSRNILLLHHLNVMSSLVVWEGGRKKRDRDRDRDRDREKTTVNLTALNGLIPKYNKVLGPLIPAAGSGIVLVSDAVERCVSERVCVYVCVCMYVCMYICVFVCVRINVYGCVCMCICSNILFRIN